MRVTNIYLANNLLNSIQHNLGRLARSQEQLATGKRVLRPSDDPANMGEFLKIKSALSYREQYALNIEDGLSYLDVTDTSMSTLSAVLSKALEYAIQAANDTYNAEDRKAVAQQIDKIIDQVVDLANTTVGGRYIYGGTKNDIRPFERVGDKIIFKGNTAEVRREVAADTNYRIDTPGIGTGFKIEMKGTLEPPKIINRQNDVNVEGSFKIKVMDDDGSNAISVEITGDLFNSSDTYELDNGIMRITSGALEGFEINLAKCLKGAEYTFTIDNSTGVFGNGWWDSDKKEYVVYDATKPKDYTKQEDAREWGIFDTLFQLRDYLNNDDTDGLQVSIGQLQKEIDHVLRYQVAAGARYNHFEALKNQLMDQEIKLTQALDNIEAADIARLSIEYSRQQLSYNASLAVGASIMQTSLLNFLK